MIQCPVTQSYDVITQPGIYWHCQQSGESECEDKTGVQMPRDTSFSKLHNIILHGVRNSQPRIGLNSNSASFDVYV
jgi:hypothetical protein